MFKKAGSIVLPLIVLAGLRRCPQMHVECGGCGSVGGGIPMTLILSSIVAVVAVAALVLRKRGAKAL